VRVLQQRSREDGKVYVRRGDSSLGVLKGQLPRRGLRLSPSPMRLDLFDSRRPPSPTTFVHSKQLTVDKGPVYQERHPGLHMERRRILASPLFSLQPSHVHKHHEKC
jgi:hypothetical protein